MDKTAVFGTADGGSIPSEGTMINIIILDTDGIVVHREMYFSQRFSQTFGVPPEKVLRFFKNEFQLCLTGKADLKEELSKYTPEWGWTKSVDDLLMFWFENENTIDQKILEHIQTLRKKGVCSYIDTNNEKYRAAYLFDNLGLKQFFDGTFSSAQLGCLKPQQEFWSAIHDALGKPNKADVLVWDDDHEHVEAAKLFGFHAERYSDFDTFTNRMSSFGL